MPGNNEFRMAQWRQDILKDQKKINDLVRAAMPALGRYVRDTIRKRIPPGNTSTSGMSNPFPGYAATGRMKSMVVSGPIQEAGEGQYRLRVGIAANATVLDRIKLYVHEYGMVIRPRRPGGVLRFQVGNDVVFSKRVRIRAKRFMRSGWDEASRNYDRILDQEIARRWPRRLGGGS